MSATYRRNKELDKLIKTVLTKVYKYSLYDDTLWICYKNLAIKTVYDYSFCIKFEIFKYNNEGEEIFEYSTQRNCPVTFECVSLTTYFKIYFIYKKAKKTSKALKVSVLNKKEKESKNNLIELIKLVEAL